MNIISIKEKEIKKLKPKDIYFRSNVDENNKRTYISELLLEDGNIKILIISEKEDKDISENFTIKTTIHSLKGNKISIVEVDDINSIENLYSEIDTISEKAGNRFLIREKKKAKKKDNSSKEEKRCKCGKHKKCNGDCKDKKKKDNKKEKKKTESFLLSFEDDKKKSKKKDKSKDKKKKDKKK